MYMRERYNRKEVISMSISLDTPYEFSYDREYMIPTTILESFRMKYPSLSRDSIIKSFGVKRFIV